MNDKELDRIDYSIAIRVLDRIPGLGDERVIEMRLALEDRAKQELNDLFTRKLKEAVEEAYRRGYNDNARNCYCDSPGATEGVLPHKHLLTDETSVELRPDISKLGKENTHELRYQGSK